MHADEPVHQEADDAHAQKENVEPSDDSSASVMTSQPAANIDRPRTARGSSSNRAAKSRRSKHSTGSSSSTASHRRSDMSDAQDLLVGEAAAAGQGPASQLSGVQHSAVTDSAAQASTTQISRTQRSSAPASSAQSSMAQRSGPLQAADTNVQVQTPVKAQQPKASSDLDTLLGSKRKPVQPTKATEADRLAAESPIAGLRSQLRRVKLEGSPGRAVQGFADAAALSEVADEDALGRQAVALRPIKQEPNADKVSGTALNSGNGRAKKVSALTGFWETQTGK